MHFVDVLFSIVCSFVADIQSAIVLIIHDIKMQILFTLSVPSPSHSTLHDWQIVERF